MAFEIPTDLPRDLMPLAWLIGSWRGTGKGDWPTTGEFEYEIRVDISHTGGNYLHHVTQAFTLDHENESVNLVWTESGFWRPVIDNNVELVIANPEGWAEVWTGTWEPAKLQLVTDAVMRTQSADVEYNGGHRMFGLVQGDLYFTMDRAATDIPLQPFLWAVLKRA